MNKFLDFSSLMNLEVATPEKVKVQRGTLKTDIKGDFRITKSGHIYYSDSFKKELEVLVDVQVEETGTIEPKPFLKYLDVIDGTKVKWSNDQKADFMFVAIQPVGTAKAAIQGGEGKVAFVDKWFKQIANACYAVNWETESFIDFTLLKDKAKEFKIFNIPRTNKKGEPDYARRENITMYPCVPTSMIPPVVVQQEIEFPEVVNESVTIE
jgi:hypothetical protein